MAFGNGSTTRPSISMAPSFFGISSGVPCVDVDLCRPARANGAVYATLAHAQNSPTGRSAVVPAAVVVVPVCRAAVVLVRQPGVGAAHRPRHQDRGPRAAHPQR